MARPGEKVGGEITLGGSALPLLAAAAIGNAQGPDGEKNSALNSILAQLLGDELEKRQKAKAKNEKMLLQNALAAKDEMEARETRIRTCSHRKQDQSTRLAGQRTSGSGRIVLVCQFCNAEFFEPALAGERPVPSGLWPSGDQIGG